MVAAQGTAISEVVDSISQRIGNTVSGEELASFLSRLPVIEGRLVHSEAIPIGSVRDEALIRAGAAIEADSRVVEARARYKAASANVSYVLDVAGPPTRENHPFDAAVNRLASARATLEAARDTVREELGGNDFIPRLEYSAPTYKFMVEAMFAVGTLPLPVEAAALQLVQRSAGLGTRALERIERMAASPGRPDLQASVASRSVSPAARSWDRLAESELLAQQGVQPRSLAPIPSSTTSAKPAGFALVAKEPRILSSKKISEEAREYLVRQFGIKRRALQRAAEKGELKWSPGTESVRIEGLQAAYRKSVATRFERRWGKPLDMSRLNADHPVDLIVGGSADQRLRMLDYSLNKSVGASLLRAGEKANLKRGDIIKSVDFIRR